MLVLAPLPDILLPSLSQTPLSSRSSRRTSPVSTGNLFIHKFLLWKCENSFPLITNLHPTFASSNLPVLFKKVNLLSIETLDSKAYMTS